MMIRITISFLNDTYRIIWDKPTKAKTMRGRLRALDIATKQAFRKYPKGYCVECSFVEAV